MLNMIENKQQERSNCNFVEIFFRYKMVKVYLGRRMDQLRFFIQVVVCIGLVKEVINRLDIICL